MFKAIKSGKYDFPSPFWDDVEPGAKDMIGCLLVLDTEKRYSAEQVRSTNMLRGSHAGMHASLYLSRYHRICIARQSLL